MPSRLWLNNSSPALVPSSLTRPTSPCLPLLCSDLTLLPLSLAPTALPTPHEFYPELQELMVEQLPGNVEIIDDEECTINLPVNLILANAHARLNQLDSILLLDSAKRYSRLFCQMENSTGELCEPKVNLKS